MFTTGDALKWRQLPEDVKDLARRYFLMHPDKLVPTDSETREKREWSAPMIEVNGIRMRDRRASRRAYDGGRP